MLGPEHEEAAGTVALCPRRRAVYAVGPEHTLGARRLVGEAGPPEAPTPRLPSRSTTLIHTHVLNRGPAGVRSLVDRMFL